MKNFYEMMRIVEEEEAPPQQDVQAADAPEVAPPEAAPPEETSPKGGGMERKHYMFFSNLKAIRGMVDDMLSMDAAEVDAMLDDGHDWASDHISTSRDDVEEVHNWLSGTVGEKG